MTNDGKNTYFKIFITVFLGFYGECIWLSLWNLKIGIIVTVFFTVGLAFLLILSKTNPIKLLISYRAQKKGKKFYGYIYQIATSNNNIIDDVIEMHPNQNRKEQIQSLRTITSSLILKIIIYDDTKIGTTLIEEKIGSATVINNHINEKDYICLYKYKNKYYILPDACRFPEFLIPKNYRLEMQKHLNDLSKEVQI